MRIRGLGYFITPYLQKVTIHDTSVVIDGHNYFYTLYSENFKNSSALGSESDRFADCVREDLMKYKNANVKCYIVFKGGTNDFECSLSKYNYHGRDFNMGDKHFPGEPIFANEICKQVLTEMEFDYVIAKDEAKTECIVLAQKLSCPIIAFDIEYLFSGVDYIPYKAMTKSQYSVRSIKYNKLTRSLECDILKFNSFLRSCRITKEKLALFAVLTDEYIFPRHFFDEVFLSLKIFNHPYSEVSRIRDIFFWLSQEGNDLPIKEIYRFINAKDQEKFSNAREKLKTILKMQVDAGIPTRYFTNRDDVDITDCDPYWFEKGVALRHVDVFFINIFKYKTVIASKYVEDFNQENSIIMSMDIIKYAYDLLTNFKGGEICLRYKKSISWPILEDSVTIDYSILQPEYEAVNCVFENGWRNIRRLNLFHHFIQETLQFFDFNKSDRAPKDSRLLIIALIYFSRKKPNESKDYIYSILLSYVLLSVVLDKARDNCKVIKIDETKLPLLDVTVDVTSVTADDCDIARFVLEDFTNVSRSEFCRIFDRKTLHPLVQFQQCLRQLNNLNSLCGEPFEPTKYSRTYNGTFVYKVLMFLKESGGIESIKNKLNPAASVLAFFSGMIEVYEEVMY